HLVPVVELDAEHRVRKGLGDLALHLDLVLLGQASLRAAPEGDRRAQIFVTFTAFGPLSPCSSSYETLLFSWSVLKPEPLMPVWWTNRSRSPSSGVMKP